MNSKRKPIRVFHPRKFWLALAVLALTVGVGVGEAQFRSSQVEVLVAHKMTRNMQTFSLKGLFGGKQGFARTNHKVSYIDAQSANPLSKHNEPLKSGIKSVCFIDNDVEEAIYSADIVEVKLTDHILPGEEFRVEAYVKNTGNVTWFGLDSKCADKTIVNMGTDFTRDRDSLFFEEGPEAGWVGSNRVKMVEDAIKPNEVATFAFTGTAPMEHTIYREHFNLVAEDMAWFDEFNIPVDIRVGDVTEQAEYEVQFLKDVSMSTQDLVGDHKIRIDLSDQSMTLLIGETEAYNMTVSTGAWDTPTPVGTFRTLNKQELRIGGAAPHYRMPYWQGFTPQGHGLHALPYLGDPGGWFWEEALDHIGIPVSHGCIRMLPEDAALVYEFGDVGIEIEIVR